MIPDVAALVTDLADRLEEAGAGVVDRSVPEEPLPPTWIVQGGDNVIQADPDATHLGEYLVSLEVVILVPLDSEHDNQAATDALYDALRVLAAALESNGSDWWLVSVGQPGTLQTTYWQHHGVLATVRTRT